MAVSFSLPPLSLLLIAIVREEGVEVEKLLPGWQHNNSPFFILLALYLQL
jgi:hypothetical protein